SIERSGPRFGWTLPEGAPDGGGVQAHEIGIVFGYERGHIVSDCTLQSVVGSISGFDPFSPPRKQAGAVCGSREHDRSRAATAVRDGECDGIRKRAAFSHHLEKAPAHRRVGTRNVEP